MASLEPSVWRDLLAYMRRQHAPICRQWFDELRPVDLSGGLLRIQTQSDIQQRYLEGRCRDQFNDALQAVTQKLITVEFMNGAGKLNGATGNGHAAGNGAAATPATTDENAAFELHTADLDPDHTFETFITGPNNQMAYAAGFAVADQPGTTYNPLFVHAAVGMGKTHLLHAICQRAKANFPDIEIRYVSCGAFVRQLLACIKSRRMQEFHDSYRKVGMLVIDDIHFLAKREQSQEEFFHTFNELRDAKRQIVLSSDAAPTEIPHLEQRLSSRFKSGLIANIVKPEFETRVAILQAKARLRGVDLPDEVVELIATRVDANPRDLEAAVNNLLGQSSLLNRPVDLDLTRQVLGAAPEDAPTGQVTLPQITDVVTDYFNVKLADLQSRRRHKSVTEPRQLCMWLARQHTRFSLEEIGAHFGGRDHTTVMYGVKTIAERLDADPIFSRQVEKLREQLGMCV